MIKLRENENIYLIKRRHPIVFFFELLPIGIVIFVLLTLMIFSAFSSFSFLEGIEFLEIFSGVNIRFLILFIISFAILVCWWIAIIITTHYYLDCWIITNERTIHTELRSLFSRIYSTVPHDRIQDVTIDIHGIFPTIFKYGNLQIQTAGSFKEFVFRQIPNPYETKKILFKAQKENKQNEKQ